MPIFAENWKRYFDIGLIPYPADPKIKGTYISWEKEFPPEKVTQETLQEWAEKCPKHNIWVIIGDRAVIDPDGEGAEEFVKSLDLPRCPTSISGKKSIHRWWKISAPLDYIKALNGGDKTFLELRTGKMGMLVPPSIHPETGKPYRWAEGLSPWEIPFPELPIDAYEKIRNLLKKPEPKMESALPENPSQGSLDVRKYLDHFGIKYRIKPDGARTIYALERCLWADQHSTPSAKGDSSIIQGADGKLGYQCFHNHCALRTWKDARELISGNAPLSDFLHGRKEKPEKRDDRAYVGFSSVVLSAGELVGMELPERKKILTPWLGEETLTLISGFRGSGKTWFALTICDSVRKQRNFGKWEAVTSYPCLYIDGELALRDVQDRIQYLDKLNPSPELAPLLLYSDYQANRLGFPKANLGNYKFQDAVLKACESWSVKLLVLDNLSSLCPRIDENSKADWDPVGQFLLQLRFAGVSVLILHHVNKEGGQRGTTAREDNLDFSINLVQPSDYVLEDGARFIARFSKARIPNDQLLLIQDSEYQLTPEGWRIGAVKKKNKVEVVRLISEGMTQVEIADLLKLTKGRVAQIKNEAVKDGLLTGDGDLTPDGVQFLKANNG